MVRRLFGNKNTIESPALPEDSDEYEQSIVKSVRGYLHTFKLDEQDLAEGLTIPWALGDHWGTAQATGKIGPQGHEVYDVHIFQDGFQTGVWSGQKYIEIGP